MLSAHLWSSVVTDEGRRLPWLKLPYDGVAHIVLNADALHARGAASDYWQRMLILHGPLAIDWGRLIDGSDVPLSPDVLSAAITSLPKLRQRSPKALEDDLQRTLAEAATACGTNAVERAVVPLACGPLATAELVQSDPDVLVIWRTLSDEFAVFAVNPAGGTWATLDLWKLDAALPKHAMVRFETTAKLLIAETIRDLRKIGDSGLLDLSSWQPFPLQIEQDLYDPKANDRKPSHRTSWTLHGVRPSDAYIYMKARFGAPNGMMSALRKPDSDNLFHWQYNVSAGDDLFMMLASNARIECRAFTRQPFSLADRCLLGARFQADFRKHGTAMGGVRSDLESWDLFENPYARLMQALSLALDELNETPVGRPIASTPPVLKRAEAEDSLRSRREWLARAAKAFQASLTIRVLAPICGEAFVNLVLLVLRSPELKEDERLYDELRKRHIDIRACDLHRYCIGFRRALNRKHPAFRNFHSLMNARNDLLHGNVSPSKPVDSVLFDGTIPLFNEQRSFEVSVATQLFRPEYVDEAIRAMETVKAFTDYVLSCMEVGAARELRMMMNVNPLGYRKKTQRFGILFGPIAENIWVEG